MHSSVMKKEGKKTSVSFIYNAALIFSVSLGQC